MSIRKVVQNIKGETKIVTEYNNDPIDCKKKLIKRKEFDTLNNNNISNKEPIKDGKKRKFDMPKHKREVIINDRNINLASDDMVNFILKYDKVEGPKPLDREESKRKKPRRSDNDDFFVSCSDPFQYYIRKTSGVYNREYIYYDIMHHLYKKSPFSLIRFGDGDIILMGMKNNKGPKRENIFIKQGFEEKDLDFVVSLYRESANNANYLSVWNCWLPGWQKDQSEDPSILDALKNWKNKYKSIGIRFDKQKYCHPYISLFLFLDDEFNLLRSIKDKKICILTSRKKALNLLKENGYNAGMIKIPEIGKGQKHKYPIHIQYYDYIIDEIKEKIDDYDIFFVSGGSLARGYTNTIKENGGIALDIGRMIGYWSGEEIIPKLKKYISFSENRLSLKTTLKKDYY